MPRGDKDHASNWLIQHYSRALVRLLGVERFQSCHAAHARLTLPQVLPDGLVEVVVTGRASPLLVLLEIEAYPSDETVQQVAKDMDMAEAALGVLPDTTLLVLCPKGQKKQKSDRVQKSELGWATRGHSWRVQPLWEILDKDLLALNEIGLTPLLPLTKSEQSVDTLVQQCKDRIEQQAPPKDQAALLTITAIMASMRSRHVEQWLSILGGKNVVEHSPLYQMWMAEKERQTKQAAIVSILEARFKEVPEEVAAHVRTVSDLNKLEQGIKLAVLARSVKAFHKKFSKP